MSRDRSSPSRPIRSTATAQPTDRPRRNDVELAPGDTLEQRIQPRPLVAPPGVTDPLIADSAIFSRADCLCFGLAGAAGREFAHGEDVVPDAN